MRYIVSGFDADNRSGCVSSNSRDNLLKAIDQGLEIYPQVKISLLVGEETRSDFESLVEFAEGGEEVHCQAYKSGVTAIWYKRLNGTEYKVEHDTKTGDVESVQVVGEAKVSYPGEAKSR